MDLEIYFWIDWPCVDQTAPGPDMAALPAYVSTCSLILSYWHEDYTSRAWCQARRRRARAAPRCRAETQFSQTRRNPI